MTMAEAVKQYVGIDFMAIHSDEEAVAAAKAIGVELPETAKNAFVEGDGGDHPPPPD